MKVGRFGTVVVAAVMIVVPAAASFAAESAGDAKAAFERLKKLNGDWQGHVGTADGPEVNVTYRVTGAGSVVMETLDPGKPHEMVSMYHLDGKELVMTHYCAGGNQPHLRLNPAASSATELTFDLTGGSNLNPAVDSHMHSGKLLLKDEGHIESAWTGYDKGKPSGEKRFFLTRKKP